MLTVNELIEQLNKLSKSGNGKKPIYTGKDVICGEFPFEVKITDILCAKDGYIEVFNNGLYSDIHGDPMTVDTLLDKLYEIKDAGYKNKPVFFNSEMCDSDCYSISKINNKETRIIIE